MHKHPAISRVRHSASFGGKCALVFAPMLFVFLFATILMVGGDGTAPGVTHLSAAIIGFTVKLLGVSFEGAIAPTVLFWSLVVFFIAFLYALIFSGTQSRPADQEAAWHWPLGVVVIVIGAALLLVQNHRNEEASVREKALALEFVRNNSEVMQAVGGKGRVDLVSYTKGQNKHTTYDIGAYGVSTLMPSWKLQRALLGRLLSSCVQHRFTLASAIPSNIHANRNELQGAYQSSV